MKKTLICLFATLLACSTAIFPVNAQEEDDVLNYDDFEIVDDTTLKDDENVYYVFETTDDRNEFLIALDLENYPNLYVCLPGDPGYPHCNTNPVVKTETKVVNSYVTNYINSNKNLLSNWIDGGKYGATMSISLANNVGFTVEGITVSINISTGASFNVPAGKLGNISYRAKFRVNTIQPYYTLKDGTRQTGTKYKTYTKTEGVYFGVYK